MSARLLRHIIAPAVLLALAACRSAPTLPDPGVAVRPVPVIVERRVYVPIPKDLTRREPMPEGPIAMCYDVAAQRRAAIERLHGRLEQIEAIQGTEAKP